MPENFSSFLAFEVDELKSTVTFERSFKIVNFKLLFAVATAAISTFFSYFFSFSINVFTNLGQFTFVFLAVDNLCTYKLFRDLLED